MRRPGSIESIAELEVQQAQNRGRVVRRLTAELRPFRALLLSALGFIGIGALAQAAGPYLVSRAIDHDIGGTNPRGLVLSMGLLLGVYATGAFAQRAQTTRVGTVAQELLAALRIKLFERLQVMPLSYFDRRPIGDVMSRLLSDVDTLNQFFSQGLTQLVGSLFGLAGILVAMLALNVRLALACFTLIPVMLLTTWAFAARARRAFRKTRQTVGDVTANLQEEIGGVRQAQAFNRTAVNIARFRQQNAANRDANVSAVGVTSAFSPAMDLLSTIATTLVIGYGGYQVLHQKLSIGLLAAFLIYVQQFFRPIQLAASVFNQAQSALAGAERVYAILDEPTEPADPPDAIELGRLEGRIEFDHLSFRYQQDRPVLDDFSLTVEAGTTVALVGRTGAGKTTLASLLPRFYDVSSGAVRVDGHDVRKVTRASLRRQMAMVLQEPFLFSGTIAANIGYGRPEATRAEIEAAARTVFAHEFIAALPKGYDSLLNEGGSTLSQGQRQLLAFARAILVDPRLLILDEATANIDSRTEALIQKALGTLLRGRTSLVIAHRLSTIRNADLIVVLEAGKQVEQGSHDSLIALGGRYAELYRHQFEGHQDKGRPLIAS